jgi:hypothetical protein
MNTTTPASLIALAEEMVISQAAFSAACHPSTARTEDARMKLCRAASDAADAFSAAMLAAFPGLALRGQERCRNLDRSTP